MHTCYSHKDIGDLQIDTITMKLMWGQNIFINKINNIINEKESYMKFIEELKVNITKLDNYILGAY